MSDEVLREVAEHLPDAPLPTAPAIAALALSLAVKYHDINTVQDGALYQQYKLEGRNMRELHLNDVFETAIKMEKHLLASSQRIADMVVEALEAGMVEESDGLGSDETSR